MADGDAGEQGMTANVFVDEELAHLHRDRFRDGSLARFGTAFWRRAQENGRRRPGLVKELRVIRRLGVLACVAAGYALYAEGVPALPAFLWPALTWIVLCAWVAVELGLVRHPQTGEDAAHIGPANVMTLYRGWAAVPVLLIAGSRPGPTLLWVGLCLTAGLTDLVDGTIAIRLGQESRLGRLLDPVLDACFFSAAAYSLARWGLLPGWLAALIAVRYFAPVLGGLVLMFAMGRTLAVRHTPWGQRATMATGLALVASWGANLVRFPVVLLAGIYVVAVACMVLALVGILRRAPGAVATP